MASLGIFSAVPSFLVYVVLCMVCVVLCIVVLFYVLFCVVICIVCFVSFYVLFVCKCALLPPGDNSIAVNKYIISYHIKTMCPEVDSASENEYQGFLLG